VKIEMVGASVIMPRRGISVRNPRSGRFRALCKRICSESQAPARTLPFLTLTTLDV